LSGLLLIGAYGLVFLSGLSVLIAVTNLRTLRRLGRTGVLKTFPRLSVLVPARNEEPNIRASIEALLGQDYPNMEILVLDDDSDDDTAGIVKSLAARDPRLRLLHGQPLPADWVGKHWACHQLSMEAEGELLLFVDADTVLAPGVIGDGVEAFCTDRADLLSLMPTRDARTWPDRWMAALISWFHLAWFPVGVAHSVSNSYLSATYGQFMLFRREAYEGIGGYEAIRGNPLDDFELGRRTKAAGLRWRLLDGSGRVVTQTYLSAREAMDGLCRSIFPAFGYNIALFLLTWLALAALGLAPIAVLGKAALAGPVAPVMLKLSALTAVMLLISWVLASVRFDFSVFYAFLFPLIIMLTLYVGFRSMVLTIRDRQTWKGRTLEGIGPADPHTAVRQPRTSAIDPGDDAVLTKSDHRDINPS